MKNNTIDLNGITCKRIPKNKARALYNSGKCVYLMPCKCSNIVHMLLLQVEMLSTNHDFDTLVSYFENINCNTVNGLYAAYYEEV